MPTEELVVLLTAERDRLNRAIEALQGGAGGPSPGENQKRSFSTATRRRMAQAQKRRWATARKGASASASPAISSPPKRHISEEGMRRIVAAAKKRWARHRAEQAKVKRGSAPKGSRVQKKTATQKAAPTKAA